MRFKATNNNLQIQVSGGEIADCVRRVVRLLVPRHTRKVYLYAEQKPPFQIDEAGLALVGPNDLPSNFLLSFRLLLYPGELVVVAGQCRFMREQWRDFAAGLEVYAAKSRAPRPRGHRGFNRAQSARSGCAQRCATQ
jgi:hypothetical protein